MDSNIPTEVIARAVIVLNNQLLVCNANGKDWYFLPGGHVESGESVEEALKREIMEEIGVSAKILDSIAIVENFYEQDGIKHHEINHMFFVEVSAGQVASREDHIDFLLVDLVELPNTKLLPQALKESLVGWLSKKI